MNEDPRIRVCVTRRIPGPTGRRDDFVEFTVDLSRIPATSNSELSSMMMERVSESIDSILAEIAHQSGAQPAEKAPSIKGAFARKAAETPTETAPEPSAEDFKQRIDVVAAKLLGEAEKLVAMSELPSAEELMQSRYADAFDHTVLWASEDALARPITRVNKDGTGGGQLKALQAALTSLGFSKDKARYAVCTELIGRWTNSLYVCTSTRDLSEGYASMILEWLSTADEFAFEGLKSSVVRAIQDPVEYNPFAEEVEQ